MKGIIVEIQDKSAVLLTDNGEFREIRNKGYVIGQSVIYNTQSYTRIASVAASILLCLFVGIGGFKIYFTPISYIDIDINPSMRLGLNTFKRVIEYIPLNDDARVLLYSIDKIRGNVNECLEELVEKSEDLGFINSENYDVNIEVVSSNQKLYNEMEKFCENISENDNKVKINVNRSDEEKLNRAKELGISVGKLKILENNESKNSYEIKSENIVSEENLQSFNNSSNDEVEETTNLNNVKLDLNKDHIISDNKTLTNNSVEAKKNNMQSKNDKKESKNPFKKSEFDADTNKRLYDLDRNLENAIKADENKKYDADNEKITKDNKVAESSNKLYLNADDKDNDDTETSEIENVSVPDMKPNMDFEEPHNKVDKNTDIKNNSTEHNDDTRFDNFDKTEHKNELNVDNSNRVDDADKTESVDKPPYTESKREDNPSFADWGKKDDSDKDKNSSVQNANDKVNLSESDKVGSEPSKPNSGNSDKGGNGGSEPSKPNSGNTDKGGNGGSEPSKPNLGNTDKGGNGGSEPSKPNSGNTDKGGNGGSEPSKPNSGNTDKGGNGGSEPSKPNLGNTDKGGNGGSEPSKPNSGNTDRGGNGGSEPSKPNSGNSDKGGKGEMESSGNTGKRK